MAERDVDVAARQNLSAEQWAEAALDAMAAGGLEAVAVEPLARRLGVTKGSFYWHFPNRLALIKSALALWERHEIDDLVRRVIDEPDPYERLVRVFKSASSSYRSGRLYLALASASNEPDVAEVLQRVSVRRLGHLHDCYLALGMNNDDAQRWATFAYATFLGNQQLHRESPGRFPQGQDFREYFNLMVEALIPKPQHRPDKSPPAVVSLRASGKGA